MGNSLVSGASLLLEGDIENIRPLNAGYRILGIHPNTAASRAGLVSFFDFIVGCNDKLLFPPPAVVSDGSLENEVVDEAPDDNFLVMEMERAISMHGEIELLVYNIKSRLSRCVKIDFSLQKENRNGIEEEGSSSSHDKFGAMKL